jgi:threonine synthase
MRMNWRYACNNCDFSRPGDQPIWRCPNCSGALHVEGLPAFRSPSSAAGLWRYSATLPIEAPVHGTILGEGGTPLVPVEIDDRLFHLKLDSLLPTGSFKDRGAAVLAGYLKQAGVRRIVVDSSGNAAAAMAAYAAACGLECTVFVPASASPGKLVQARAAGANVLPVEGSREDVTNAAQAAAAADPEADYASHNFHPVFVEGVKTWALEVWEQLDERSPDLVFTPCGGGSALVGAYRGFLAVESSMPRLIACQPAACAPVAKAWECDGEIGPFAQGDTIAEGTRIAMPSRPRQIMNAIRESNGWASVIDDDFLVETLRMLWGKGFSIEPTGALGVAAFRLANRAGKIGDEDSVVCHATGHGLKATPTIASLL